MENQLRASTTLPVNETRQGLKHNSSVGRDPPLQVILQSWNVHQSRKGTGFWVLTSWHTLKPPHRTSA